MGNQRDEQSDQPDPMMQLRVRDLETGMVLARTVYSQDGCTLFKEGKRLDTRDIDRLRMWDKRYVYVKPTDDSQPSDTFAQAS